ncbi:MAG: hypothetical protein HUJ86_03285, partial [Synergistes sp.]|nr:hypothetical protein [Synergistes sp.]
SGAGKGAQSVGRDVTELQQTLATVLQEVETLKAKDKEKQSKIDELEAKDKKKDQIIEELKNALEEKKK